MGLLVVERVQVRFSRTLAADLLAARSQLAVLRGLSTTLSCPSLVSQMREQ